MRSTSRDFLEVLSHYKDTSCSATPYLVAGCSRENPLHEPNHSLLSLLTALPNTVIHQHDLNNLVDQLPAPFIILGDFKGHSTLWGSAKTNPRGRQIEQVLSDHCLCLLNHEEPTYFHEPTRSFHTIDLAICSPSAHHPLRKTSIIVTTSLLSFLTILIRVEKPSHLRILIVVQTGLFSRSWL
ncbi:hypothetical protein TNCV_4698401 [Trichonephila clavipes]|nr:hypothetical protein TNCV_4698401 [Trichonephila clavipes]